MAADARLEVRVSAHTKERLAHVAALVERPASDLVRSALEEYLERVLEEHLAVTRVRADVFDALMGTLDEPDVPNEPLRRAAARAGGTVVRD